LSEELQIRGTATCSPTFARHHGLALPQRRGRLELGAEFARGGFGALRPVTRIDSTRPARAIVAKLFSPSALQVTGGSQVLTARVAELHRALEARPSHDWCTALLALPFCLVSAQLPDGIALVALMLDLRVLGYRPSPFAQHEEHIAHHTRPAHERIDLALRYAERAALLEEIGFVHSDQNPENLMVTDTDVQIIDFDAGVIVRSGDERPLTAGKPDDCMPPEVKPADPAAPIDLSRYTPQAARWSVASLVGYLLLGSHPAFFLRSISPQAIAEYAASGAAWPEIDQTGPLYTRIEQSRLAYASMRGQLRALPEAVRRLFAQLFAAGLDAERRPAASEWVPALAGLREPPVIDRFEPDDTFVLEGGEVTVSWSVRNAERVELVGHGPQTVEGELRLILDRTTVLELRAEGPYGRRMVRTPVIRVIRLPRIETLPMPALPELTPRVAAGVAPTTHLTLTLEPPELGPLPRISAPRRYDGAPVPAGMPRLGDMIAAMPWLHASAASKRAA
jgi:hypothetical protein